MSSRPPSDDNASQSDNVVRVDFTRSFKENKAASFSDASAVELQKLKVFEDLLKQGTAALVLDASHLEVKVPLVFKEIPNLRLNFSHLYGIKDFAYDGRGVQATLSFSEGFYFCVIPWKAVFIIELDGTGMGAVWHDDVPMVLKPAFELKKEMPKKLEKELQPKEALKARKSSAPFLRLVTGDLKE